MTDKKSPLDLLDNAKAVLNLLVKEKSLNKEEVIAVLQAVESVLPTTKWGDNSAELSV